MLPKVKILNPNLEIYPFSKYSHCLETAHDIDLCELAAKELLKKKAPTVQPVDIISLDSFYPSPILKRKAKKSQK